MKFIRFIKRPKGMLIVGVGVVIVSFFVSMTGNNLLEAYDISKVEYRDLIRIVDVTGRVEPADRVNMAFEKGGKVVRINVAVGEEVKEGQILLNVSNADLYADLAGAQASLEIERLELSKVGKTSAIDLESTRLDLLSEIQDAFIEADNAIRNKADQLFKGFEPNKQFGVPIETGGNNNYFGLIFDERTDLNQQRKDVGFLLNDWRDVLLNLEGLDIKKLVQDFEDNLIIIREFLNELSFVVNDYSSTYASNTILDGYRTSLSTARSNINTAISNVRSSKQSYLLIEASSVVQEQGLLQDSLIQEQKVKNAEARVNAVWAEINKTLIKAPFDGQITRVDTEVGETVSSNDSVVSMISDNQFEIETFIPEADIAEITIGNSANVTLDAHDSNTIFGAYVSFIDPAETIIEGVATYKVLLQFNEEDERVFSGMTANVDIITGSRENVIAVPQRAVVDKDGLQLVRIVRGDETEEVEVEIGLRAFDGYIEILDGLNEGDQIVVFVRG